jgi:hypothetical protein
MWSLKSVLNALTWGACSPRGTTKKMTGLDVVGWFLEDQKRKRAKCLFDLFRGCFCTPLACLAIKHSKTRQFFEKGPTRAFEGEVACDLFATLSYEALPST